MKIGYSFWGFLSDVKLDKNNKELSTPDGNAYYSWAIINEFQKLNYTVIAPFPNRDKYAFLYLNKKMFGNWASDIREKSYLNTIYCDFPEELNNISEQEIFNIWNNYNLNDCTFILHEWRMPIKNRNLLEERNNDWWQPDLFLQQCIINYCKLYNIKLYIFDLDNKFKKEHIDYNNYQVIELGTKNKENILTAMPFNFDYINTFSINNNPKYNLVYVGNRYERDWCIDKYIPPTIDNILIYGNWLEGGRDSANKWPLLTFKHRIQQRDMFNIYNNAICTILLAKKDYCENNIMTGRIAEALLYGTVPLFIEEYSNILRSKYANKYKNLLTVSSKEDVIDKILLFKNNLDLRKEIIEFLRIEVSKIMDVKLFIKKLIGKKNE